MLMTDEQLLHCTYVDLILHVVCCVLRNVMFSKMFLRVIVDFDLDNHRISPEGADPAINDIGLL